MDDKSNHQKKPSGLVAVDEKLAADLLTASEVGAARQNSSPADPKGKYKRAREWVHGIQHEFFPNNPEHDALLRTLMGIEPCGDAAETDLPLPIAEAVPEPISNIRSMSGATLRLPGIPGHVCFVPRAVGQDWAHKQSPDVIVYDAAAKEPGPAFLNPFYFAKDRRIPVPGQPGLRAYSVEAVWQGLKLVDGKTDFARFHNRPHKRPTSKERQADPDYDYQTSQFQYGLNVLDLATARRVIYVPTYRYLFEHYVPEDFKDEVCAHLVEGRRVLIHDWDDNPRLDDTRTPFAHGALLAQLLNEYAERQEISFPVGGLVRHDPLQFAGTDDLVSAYLKRFSYYAMGLDFGETNLFLDRLTYTTDSSVIGQDDDGADVFLDQSATLQDKGFSVILHGDDPQFITPKVKLRWLMFDLASRSFCKAAAPPLPGLSLVEAVQENIQRMVRHLTTKGLCREKFSLLGPSPEAMTCFVLTDGSLLLFLVQSTAPPYGQEGRLWLYGECGMLAEDCLPELMFHGKE